MKLSKLTLSVLFSMIALVAVFVCAKMLMADTGSSAFGYMWSSNIGWIKLNDCDDPANASTCSGGSYGVSIPSTNGPISGYAWSSNIGWISFNDATCPTTGCTPGATITWNSDGTGTIKGWARACSIYISDCSGSVKSDGYLGTWDGYIALDSSTGGGSGGSWGLSIGTDKKIGGYSWGSQVIGWINSVTASISLKNSVSLVANPSLINKGESSTLTATAGDIDGPNACSIDGAPTLTMAKSGSSWTGSVAVSPVFTTPYTVNCTKAGQTLTASATVTVHFFKSPDGCTPGVNCPPGGCTTTPCTPPEGPNGGPTGNGYCAVTNPQLAWDSDSTTCTISKGGNSVSVPGSSKAAGGSLGTDGLYYYSVNLPIGSGSSTYSLQCGSSTLTTIVSACQKDYSISATPSSTTFTPSADGKTMTATFTVSINPQYAFSDDIGLAVDTYPTNMPKSRADSFSPSTVTSVGGSYGTSTLTISVAAGDLKKADSYAIVIKGVSSGGLSRRANITINSVEKTKPVFNEF